MKLKTLFIALIIIGLFVLNYHFPFKEYLQTAVEWSENQGHWGAIFFFMIFVACVVFFIPISPLIMLAGTVYGFWPGFILVSLAGLASVALTYALGKKLWTKKVEQLRIENPRFESILKAIDTHGASLAFLIRLNPLIPYSLLNYLFTIPKMDFRLYLLSSFLGMAPDIMLYLYVGRMGQNWLDDSQGLTSWNWIILSTALLTTGTAIFIIQRLIRKANQASK